MTSIYDGTQSLHQLDSNTINELNRVGATILCIGVPPKSKFGIDYRSWTVGDKFKGIKMVPPGTHFIAYSPPQRHPGDVVPYIGMFVHLEAGQVLVRKWDTATDTLVTMDEEEAGRFAMGVKRMDFDQFLAPYPLDTYKEWVPLANFITPQIIRKLQPHGSVTGGIAGEQGDGFKPGTFRSSRKEKQQHAHQLAQSMTAEQSGAAFAPTSSSHPAQHGTEFATEARREGETKDVAMADSSNQSGTFNIGPKTLSPTPLPGSAILPHHNTAADALMSLGQNERTTLGDLATVASSQIPAQASLRQSESDVASLLSNSPSASAVPIMPLSNSAAAHPATFTAPIPSAAALHPVPSDPRPFAVSPDGVPTLPPVSSSYESARSATVIEPLTVYGRQSGEAFDSTKAAAVLDATTAAAYSTIPLGKMPASSSAAEITAFNLDKSQVLASLLSKEYPNDPLGLVGELQFAFIAFLMGESLEGFEQWKHLVSVFCSAEKAMAMPSFSRLFVGFAQAFYQQLNAAPADFFVDPLARENFLTHSLRDLFDIVFSSPDLPDGSRLLGSHAAPSSMSVDFAQQVKQLKKLMKSKFNWDYDSLVATLDNEDDEYAPVVVEMPETATAEANQSGPTAMDQ